MNTNREDWIIKRSEEVALQLTNYEFNQLGPHLQMMCYMKAEEDYINHFSSMADHIYDEWKESQLLSESDMG